MAHSWCWALLACCALLLDLSQQQQDGLSGPSGSGPSAPDNNNNGGAAEGDLDCQCVPYFLCDPNNTIIDNGQGLIDVRSSVPQCAGEIEVCCRLPASASSTPSPAPTPDYPDPEPQPQPVRGNSGLIGFCYLTELEEQGANVTRAKNKNPPVLGANLQRSYLSIFDVFLIE